MEPRARQSSSNDRILVEAGHALDRARGEAVVGAERTVAVARLGICASLLVREVALTDPDPSLWKAYDVVVPILLVIGIALSIYVLRRGVPVEPERVFRWSLATTLFDVSAPIVSFMTLLFDPPQGFVNLVELGYLIIFPTATASAGLRFSRRISWIGGGVSLAGLVGVLLVDTFVTPPAGGAPLGKIVFVLLAELGAIGIAVASASFTHAIAVAGARAIVDAIKARVLLATQVSDEVAQLLLTDEAGTRAGREAEVAVLFCDLRGFTSQSEGRRAKDVVDDLNALFASLVPEIGRRGGVVDKFIGDAVMAVFGLSTHAALDPARAALDAAEAMLVAVERLNVERATVGRAPLHIGIGVHFGPVIAASVGTTERAEFTIIGDTVNVASRVETATRDLGVRLLVTDVVVARLPEEAAARVVAVGEIRPRGRQQGVEVFTLRDGASSTTGDANAAAERSA